MPRLLLHITLSFLLPNVVIAQVQFSGRMENGLNSGFTEDLRSDIISMYTVGKGFLESPLHYTSEDFILVGVVVGATALSFTLDNSVRTAVRSTQGVSMDKITAFGEKFGNVKYGAALSGILYLGGHLVSDRQTRETGLILFETLLLNSIVTEGLKIALGRSRPHINEGNLDLLDVDLETENHSLPSGHTSTAFAIATVLSRRIGSTYASIGLYSLAGLTVYQRVYADKHWISDTILGAAIGIGIGLKVVELYSEHTARQSIQPKLNIIPYRNSEGYGFGLSFVF